MDIKLFAELVKIETALIEKQSVTEALAWCGENRGTLKKTKVSRASPRIGELLRGTSCRPCPLSSCKRLF